MKRAGRPRAREANRDGRSAVRRGARRAGRAGRVGRRQCGIPAPRRRRLRLAATTPTPTIAKLSMAPSEGAASQRSDWSGSSDGDCWGGSEAAGEPGAGSADAWTGAPAASASASPARKGTSARTKAAASCGVRLVSRAPWRTTSWFSQTAPALTRSSRRPGHAVRVRPAASPQDTSTRAACDIAAIGLPAASKAHTKSRTWADWRNRSGAI